MSRARVLIVEDHPLVAQGLRALIAPLHDVVGMVADARDVLDAIARFRPELLLLDLSMPDLNGLELLPLISEKHRQLRVLVVTMHVDRTLAQLSYRAGAHGFIPKEATADELREAIAVVLAGRDYHSPRVAARGYRDSDVVEAPELNRLTPRQREILELIGQGRQSAEIAEELGLSLRTVEFHRTGIRRALGATTEAAVMRYAMIVLGRGGAEGGMAAG